VSFVAEAGDADWNIIYIHVTCKGMCMHADAVELMMCVMQHELASISQAQSHGPH
jgi:hypothetical protein